LNCGKPQDGQYPFMEPCPNGAYVEYEDAKKAIALAVSQAVHANWNVAAEDQLRAELAKEKKLHALALERSQERLKEIDRLRLALEKCGKLFPHLRDSEFLKEVAGVMARPDMAFSGDVPSRLRAIADAIEAKTA
jgi:hypothetical protein